MEYKTADDQEEPLDDGKQITSETRNVETN